MSASIFYKKVCGQCMAEVPITASACTCGYSFEDQYNSRTKELVRQVADERAYESYLEARLQQALDRLRAVRGENVGDKWTHEQDKKAQAALQELKTARDELNAQRRRTAEVGGEVKRLRASAPPPRAASAPGERARTMPSVEGFAAVDMELSAPRLVRAPEPRPIAAAAHESGAPRDRRQTATPTERFRLLQANLAQRLFPAAVEPEHHCPHCTATVPADAVRCGCGYELKSESTIPAFAWPVEPSSPTGNQDKHPRR